MVDKLVLVSPPKESLWEKLHSCVRRWLKNNVVIKLFEGVQMIYSKLKKIAKENDWYLSNSSVFGLYRDYYFQMNDGHGFKQISIYLLNTDYEKQDSIRKAILQSKKELKISAVLLGGNILAIRYKEIFLSTSKEVLKRGLDFLSDVLKSHSVSPMNTCFQCEKSGDLKYFYNTANELTKMLCQHCIEREENDRYQNEKLEEYKEKNYIRGILGSLLFTAIGVIAWVAIAVYLHRLTAFGALLLGLLSFNGYKYFKGTLNKLAKLSLFVIIIFSIILANYISIGFEIYLKDNEILIEDIIYNLFHNDNILPILIENISISLLLSILPFYYINKYFNKNMGLSKWVLAKSAKT
ncbi:MAG: hypothetical protein C4539_00825 [Ignavibacteriales bacterium]|nr:MAG: hypothetical protein C4539_00825 [Ignavibacteriales bacterium]